METPNAKPWNYARFLSGVKTAALIVIIGTVAVAADHAFMGATPRAPAEAAPPPAAVSTAPTNAFGFADALRPTEADREPPPPSF